VCNHHTVDISDSCENLLHCTSTDLFQSSQPGEKNLSTEPNEGTSRNHSHNRGFSVLVCVYWCAFIGASSGLALTTAKLHHHERWAQNFKHCSEQVISLLIELAWCVQKVDLTGRSFGNYPCGVRHASELVMR